MKKAAIILFALIVVAGVAFVYVYVSLDNIIKVAVEQIGARLTQTEVALDAVEIAPTTGDGSLRGFRVMNPPGFSGTDAFRFDEVRVTVDMTTLHEDPVIIRDVVIEAPRIVYEVSGGTSNLGTLKNNIARENRDDVRTPANDGPRIIIENLRLRNGTVGVVAPTFTQPMDLPFPTVHLLDIGKGTSGATSGEIAQRIVDELLAGARIAVRSANIDLEALRGATEERADEAGTAREVTTDKIPGN